MELVFSDAQTFKKCVDAISVLIDEAEFVVSKDGLCLKATDPSQISMVDFRLPKAAFKEFKAASEAKIGVDLDYLSQIMSRAKPKDELVLSLDEENSKLDIRFKGTSNRRFSMPLVDISAQELPTPKIEFEAHVKISGSEIQEALKDAALVSSHLTIGVTHSKFFLEANSSKGNFEHETPAKELKGMNVKKEGKSMFPLEYLQDMLKVVSSDTIVELNMKTNAPIQVSYKIGEAELDYYLAPRIEST